MQPPEKDKKDNFAKKYYSAGVILSGIYIVVYWVYSKQPFKEIVKTTAFFILLSSITLELLGIIANTTIPTRSSIMYFAEKGYNKARLFLASLAAYAKKVDKEKEEKEKKQQAERIEQAYQKGIDEGMRRANGHNNESK